MAEPETMTDLPPTGGTETLHESFHRDGTLWARGPVRDGQPHGYWEWFRKSGTKMRSGTFEAGEQVGLWTTYDQSGAVYKVTAIKPKKAKQDA